MLNKAQRINERWEAINPKVTWGNAVSSQRETLIHLLEDDELPEHIVVGIRGGFSIRTAVLVATSTRLLCIDSKKSQSVPYHNVLLLTNKPLASCIRIKSTDGVTLQIDSRDNAAAAAMTSFIKSHLFEQSHPEGTTVQREMLNAPEDDTPSSVVSSEQRNSVTLNPVAKGCGLGCAGIVVLLVIVMLIGALGSCDDSCSQLERRVNPDGSNSLTSNERVVFIERCYDDWARRNPV